MMIYRRDAWIEIVEKLKKFGAYNAKYDPTLSGIVKDADKIDSHDAGTAAGNVLVLDTAGQVPLSNLPLLPASQLGFSFAWEKVAEISKTGVSSIEFTNLTGNVDKMYLLILVVNNPTTIAIDIFARFNADTTLGNYAWIEWGSGTLGSTSQGFNATSGTAGVKVGSVSVQGVGMFSSILCVDGIQSGTNTYVTNIGKGFDTALTYYNLAGGWIKQAEVTSITIFTSGLIDWKAYLFKPKW